MATPRLVGHEVVVELFEVRWPQVHGDRAREATVGVVAAQLMLMTDVSGSRSRIGSDT
jgi:hypothetical protein